MKLWDWFSSVKKLANEDWRRRCRYVLYREITLERICFRFWASKFEHFTIDVKIMEVGR
jgi:hypothetical protein